MGMSIGLVGPSEVSYIIVGSFCERITFGAFLLCCGFTYLCDGAMTVWPAFRILALAKVGTAIVAWAAVAGLVSATPRTWVGSKEATVTSTAPVLCRAAARSATNVPRPG